MPVGFTTVSGTHVQDATGTLLAAGEIVFQPISTLTGQPIAFRTGGTEGLTLEKPVGTPVVNGAFSIVLADTYLTTPQYIAYRVWIKDFGTGNYWNLPGYGNFQPTGSTYDIDDWEPDLTGLVTVQYGPEGKPGLPGGVVGAVIGQTDLSGPIDGTNCVYTFAGIPSAFIYVRNGVVQRYPSDYSWTVNSSTGITTVTRVAQSDNSGVLQPTVDQHWIALGITSSTSQPTAPPSSSAPVVIPILDSTGVVVGIRITNGQLDNPFVIPNYSGTTPPSSYVFTDPTSLTAWALTSASLQWDPVFYSSIPPQGSLSSMALTDAGNNSARTLQLVDSGHIQVT